jgi:hypothetical protein
LQIIIHIIGFLLKECCNARKQEEFVGKKEKGKGKGKLVDID